MSDRTVKIEMELDEESAKELQKWIESRNEEKKEKSGATEWKKGTFKDVQEALMRKSIEFLNEHNERLTLSGILAAMVSLVEVMEMELWKSEESKRLRTWLSSLMRNAIEALTMWE